MFDLPTLTIAQKKAYRIFRKSIISAGYVMFQESVYTKLLNNISKYKSEIVRIKKIAPEEGTIHALTMTLNEFKQIVTIIGNDFDVAFFLNDIVEI